MLFSKDTVTEVLIHGDLEGQMHLLKMYTRKFVSTHIVFLLSLENHGTLEIPWSPSIMPPSVSPKRVQVVLDQIAARMLQLDIRDNYEHNREWAFNSRESENLQQLRHSIRLWEQWIMVSSRTNRPQTCNAVNTKSRILSEPATQHPTWHIVLRNETYLSLPNGTQ